MVFEHDCAEIIAQKFPEFMTSKQWTEDVLYWKKINHKPGLCGIFASFGDFTEGLLNMEPNSPLLVKIFDFIEMLMCEGDQTVGDCAATCFLENLINYAGHGSVQASSFIPLLGPKSRDYCKGWDKFTGVQTPGLWQSKWEWWFYKI